MIYDIFYVSNITVSQSEFEKLRLRFPTIQKIENAKTIDDVKKFAFTKFFWIIWQDLYISDDFDFSYRVSKWEEDYVHMFKNSCNGVETYMNGVCLFPKHLEVTEKEFTYRYFVNKKEINSVASFSRYPILEIDSYKQYVNTIENSSSEMFWVVPKNIEITKPEIFNLYFDPKNGKFDYDRKENHVFLNGKFYDGLTLYSKHKKVTKKEFDNNFIVDRKEWNEQVSIPVPFDIVFLSHNEPTADKNFELLKTKFSRAKRVSGVTGIHQAHIKAAEISETEMFFVVDADAIIKDDFNFDIDQIPRYDHIALENFHKTVFIWQSENPINGLVYGYGGVKLLPRDLTLNMDLEKTDVTTGISENIKLMNSVSNITAFNYDEFSTWRSAFRECVKLASRVIDRSYDQESDHRLAMWCKNGEDKPFGSYAIKGAIAGRRYGVLNIGKTEKLNKINDYEWLRERFEESVNK